MRRLLLLLAVTALHAAALLSVSLPAAGDASAPRSSQPVRLVDLAVSTEDPRGEADAARATAPEAAQGATAQATFPGTAQGAASLPPEAADSAESGSAGEPSALPTTPAQDDNAPRAPSPIEELLNDPSERSAPGGRQAHEAAPPAAGGGAQRAFWPQHLISTPPEIPVSRVLERIDYPLLARRRGIEGVVYLELLIDAQGIIRSATVVSEPGYGLGEAAREALEGIRALPGRVNGEAVGVRYRYPVRFELR